MAAAAAQPNTIRLHTALAAVVALELEVKATTVRVVRQARAATEQVVVVDNLVQTVLAEDKVNPTQTVTAMDLPAADHTAVAAAVVEPAKAAAGVAEVLFVSCGVQAEHTQAPALPINNRITRIIKI